MFEKLFKSNIQRYMEKKNKLVNQVTVLKTQQKVRYENVNSDYESRKCQLENTIDAQISALTNEIANLKLTRKTQAEAFDKEKVVELKKIDNEFDQKILNKMNEITKLKNLIEKEEKDLRDLIEPVKTNAPIDNRKILTEMKTKKRD